MLDEPPLIVRTEYGSRLAFTVVVWGADADGPAESLN
jgi:hypothetical protein